MATRKIESDVRRRAKLPPILGQISSAASAALEASTAEGQSEAYLDTMEEDLNKRVDVEVEILVTGMTDLVALAQVCPSHTLIHSYIQSLSQSFTPSFGVL